ncbi:ribokinase [Paroceanicella profunda]|uniref:Ribokinase n=1 Tax=Paroceanicella profunda TaxID=2579971 RepID=A0A5B8FID9_9RHOB|nr:ribokinase [Paroceanicella profunda]QDL92978.1 ribokinase [Paroceanicella profunda]
MSELSGIAILGVFVADTTYRTARLPAWGETLLGAGFVLGPGGKGSNQAVAAGRLGAEVRFLSRLGADAFGEMAQAVWREAGVTPCVETVADEATGAACILVDDARGENAIIISPGAAAGITPALIEARRADIARSRVVMTQLEQPLDAARRFLEIGRAAGAVTILNPAPAAQLDAALIGLCDYVTPNETEAEMLTGVPVSGVEGAREAAEVLLRRGAKAVIVTLGAAGALYHDADASLVVPAFEPGAVVETTGAGDAFNGAFATALAEGAEPVDAVRFGCAAAALSVSRPGAAASMPRRAEVERLLA